MHAIWHIYRYTEKELWKSSLLAVTTNSIVNKWKTTITWVNMRFQNKKQSNKNSNYLVITNTKINTAVSCEKCTELYADVAWIPLWYHLTDRQNRMINSVEKWDAIPDIDSLTVNLMKDYTWNHISSVN